MAYFPKDHHPTGDEVDDFNELDPTPYGGGYDITLTYGRPLPPSEGICYRNTSSNSDYFDYNRTQYSSHNRPSAYEAKAQENEYKSYAHQETRPLPGPPAPGLRPNYGFQPAGGYGERPGPVYGSGYGGKPEFERPGSEYGSGYGPRPDYYPQPGYPMRPEFVRPEHGPGGFGRRPDYYPQPGYPTMPEIGVPNYGPRPGPEEFVRPEHGPSGYDRRGDDHQGYGHKKYGHDEEEKHHHDRHHHRRY